MLLQEEEHNYFWVGHAQIAQLGSVVVAAVLLGAAITTRPIITPPGHTTPVNFTAMQAHFTDTMHELYQADNSSLLATPPLLRQVLYRNLLPCEPNFLESHDITECDIEAKQDVELYLGTLTDAPDPFVKWSEEVCGKKPFSAARNRYTTGQGFFPSRRCELCFLPRSGYVLRLPFAPQEKANASFFAVCVAGPMSVWFKSHVREDTFAIITDAIFISSDHTTIERQQLSYERLLPLDLWWATSRPVRHYRRHWLGAVAGVLGFLVLVQQVSASMMERHGKGNYSSYFSRLARRCLRFLLMALSLALFLFFSLYDLRWDNLVRRLSAGQPSPAVANDDNAQHSYVMYMYHAFTNHAAFDSNVIWVLVVLLMLQVTDLLTCTRGYMHGASQAVRRLVAPLLVAGCWAVLVGLLGHVFHREDNVTFGSLRASFYTLFVSRDLDVRYEEDASVHLLLLLHVTVFLLVPLFLGILMANLSASRTLKRGRKRWWASGGN
ncbi:hypothetical protein E2C01_055750 [Portunus trituberculatus]|uniref:Uncharacterized protein n=1 Tax=Portunus trituberculatus TaxID=210409 RepID=A0A5B7GWD7_PORTR|nr:hypothetical protein [Portunus trituberculatus]